MKKWNLAKEEEGEMGEIFFYLQETSLLEKLYFSLVPVPNCSRTNARNSLIYLYSVLLSGAYCTWHLLWHITVLQIIPGTFTFWKYCGGKVSKSPLLTCCHQPAGTVPGPFHLASKGPKPCGFLKAAAATAWVYFGGAKCSFCWKKAATLWISVSFAKWIHLELKNVSCLRWISLWNVSLFKDFLLLCFSS